MAKHDAGTPHSQRTSPADDAPLIVFSKQEQKNNDRVSKKGISFFRFWLDLAEKTSIKYNCNIIMFINPFFHQKEGHGFLKNATLSFTCFQFIVVSCPAAP
jgi:hypothetical protein